MNAVEIEEAVSELADRPFDAHEFPFVFLTAFGNKGTTVKRLRSGSSNSSDVPGGVLQQKNIISLPARLEWLARRSRPVARAQRPVRSKRFFSRPTVLRSSSDLPGPGTVVVAPGLAPAGPRSTRSTTTSDDAGKASLVKRPIAQIKVQSSVPISVGKLSRQRTFFTVSRWRNYPMHARVEVLGFGRLRPCR